MGNSNNKFKMRSIIELILVVRQYENIVSYLNMEFKHVYNSFLHCRINNSNECSSTFQDEKGKQIFFVKPVTCLDHLSISIVSGAPPETYISYYGIRTCVVG